MEAVYENTMKKVWDKLGIALSTICLAHCVVVVVLPLLLPALGTFFHSPWIHQTFAGLVLIITPMAFMPGYRRHGLSRVLVMAWTGVALVLAGVLSDGKLPEITSHSLSIMGSGFLVTAHLLNLRHSRKAASCC
jgi:hypothetical protein